MSLVLGLTRGAVILTAAGVLWATFGNKVGNEQVPVEQGYADPKYVVLEKPVNEKGNQEFFLNYDNGEVKVTLPITEGEQGPIVGYPAYNWNSMSLDTKAQLVESSWKELPLQTRKIILKNDLENMIDTYGGITPDGQ